MPDEEKTYGLDIRSLSAGEEPPERARIDSDQFRSLRMVSTSMVNFTFPRSRSSCS